MARGGGDFMLKKNSKLESFLKRSLTDETYERIRAYESCIVVSEKENKAFKFVVLGDEWLYLTENPPKTIQEFVHLKDLVLVELVNDFPDFLSGDERINTQHLAVTYLTEDAPRRHSLRRSRRSPRNSLSDLHGDRSNASTPMGYVSSAESWSEDYGYITQSLSSLHLTRPDSRGSGSSSRDIRGGSLKSKKKKLVDSLDESNLRSLREENILEDIEEDDRMSVLGRSSRSRLSTNRSRAPSDTDAGKNDTSRKSLPKPPLESVNSKESMISVTMKQPEKQVIQNGVLHNDSEEETSCCSCFGKNKVTPGLCGGRNTDIDEKSPMPIDRKFSQQLPPGINIQQAENSSARDRWPSGMSQQDGGNSRRSSLTTTSGISRTGTPAQEVEGNRSALGMASYSDLGGSMNGLSFVGLDGDLTKRKAVIHIYLLNSFSPMLMMIRSAWNNYLIRATLQIDSGDLISARSYSIRGSVTTRESREKREQLFNQLKRELFNPANSMDETFRLLNELKIGTEKNFNLRKLFWKNSDMFLFLVRHLQGYLPKSKVNLLTDFGRNQRADEFEFVILITEILNLMFRESEIISMRVQTLKTERGKGVLDLLMILTCDPELPEYMGDKHNLGAKSNENQKTTETELDKQLKVFTQVALTGVFELFLMARQANWGYNEDSYFNISWMVRVLEELKTTELFVKRVIHQMLQLINETGSTLVGPVESVTLYQQFSVLMTFLDFSPRITVFIRSNYTEEFKYFLQVPNVMSKLPPRVPLTPITLQLADRVIAKVLATGSVYKKSPR
ncbi:hypothetical protein ScPMuIL_009047 [Solemya velum]